MIFEESLSQDRMPLAPWSVHRGDMNRSCLFATQHKKYTRGEFEENFHGFFFNSHMNQKVRPHIENENLSGKETLP